MFEQMFDLAKFALPPEEYALHDDPADNGPLPVRNPGNLEFFRVCDDPAYRARVSVLTDKLTGETNIVSPHLRRILEGDAKPAELVVAVNRDGKPFLWLAKLPAFENEAYGKTRMAALTRAKSEWIRMRPRADKKGYDVIPATTPFPDPQWPTATFSELCRDALAGKFIDTADHPVLRRLRGEE